MTNVLTERWYAQPDERIAELDDVPVLDLVRERLGEQVARRAEQRGQLDLGGAV